jgi:hypothetical protein
MGKRPAVNWTLAEIRRRSIVDPATGCWLWQRGKISTGYGSIGFGNKRFLAHRLAYAFAHGPIPAGLEICHRCDTPSCVNPEHLFAGSHQVNMADSFAKGRSRSPTAGKSHCRRGHLLSTDNVRLTKTRGYNTRVCKACEQMRQTKRNEEFSMFEFNQGIRS